jgi:fatty acid desaturase
VTTKLPDSPEDRQRRDEILRRIAIRAAIAVIPTVIVGALAVGLGVLVWLVFVICIVIVGIILFEA